MILSLLHAPSEGIGIIEDYLVAKELEHSHIKLYENQQLPQSFENIDAVFVMGGYMNVYEEEKYPFLVQENAFIKKLLEKQIPVFGICLGGQLIAKAAGYTVNRAPKSEIGWDSIKLTQSAQKDILFKGCQQDLTVFQWHGDMFNITDEKFVLATSDVCQQAFKVGKNAYGLQFHFEVTPQMAKEWIRELPAQEKLKYKANLIPAGFIENYSSCQKLALKLLENFFSVVNSASNAYL